MQKKLHENGISTFSQSEIAQLFKIAKIKVRYSGVRILTAPASQTLAGRILIITPKASGSAPERNLFKRRVRSIFRENNLANSGKDFVIITDKRGIALSFIKLCQLLVSAAQSPV